MADGKELKPKSFRIDEETAGKFKEISNRIGGNQQETLVKLIEAYEFQSGKAVLPDKKGEIEQFESYVNALTRMYMGSLEDNQNVTMTVRGEYDALLKSKDTTIQDLQRQLAASKQEKETALTRTKQFEDENIRLNQRIETISKEYSSRTESMEAMLTDKEKLNRALTDSCAELQAKVQRLTEASQAISQLEELKKEKDALQKEKEEMDKNFNLLKEQMELAFERERLTLQKEHQEQIQSLKAEQQAEIDSYQKKYLGLLEQLRQ